MCTYYGYSGHVVDKCYEPHGYPPGYKGKQKTGLNQMHHSGYHVAAANQISDSNLEHIYDNVGNFVQTLNPTQYQHLLNVLSTHLSAAKGDTKGDGEGDHVSGTSIQNAYVTFPNRQRIPVLYKGISSNLILKDILFVPQLKFNLLSVSSLTKDSSIIIKFFTNLCIIQDLSSLRMIGKARRAVDLYILEADFSDFNICHRYFLTLVDDCTRFTWIYLMKQKSDVEFIIPKAFKMVETQFQKGVLHQFSCVDRPEQNSMVERKHQHLLNVARSLSKFHPRAKPCVFVGYPPGVKGYKLYDISSKTFFISRDVVFHEYLFPFSSIPHENDLIDPFPNIVLPKPEHDIAPPSTSVHDNQPIIVDHNTQSSPQPVILRRSGRTIKPPSYLREFHCNLLKNSPEMSNFAIPYPLQKYLSYKSFSPSYCSYLLNVSSDFEPQHYHEAVKYSSWREAMVAE
ncbi:uncharacterized protein LOC111406698 [Olea europaea var. sylvestris]|uniref:uncharacterized protein LOC111406698 n=1 Tax=Olea europaea var. sylvestris TaxID=158386 RepID=UPI000C1D04F7|nr:uncharacterized protein LOC111406698 [Olea europaea var. sylvestris]